MEKETKANAKKVTDFYGYEIWIDGRNFTTVKNGVQHYYSSLYQMFYKINVEVNQKDIKNVELDKLAKTLEKREVQFLSDLKNCLGKLCLTDPEKIMEKLN